MRQGSGTEPHSAVLQEVASGIELNLFKLWIHENKRVKSEDRREKLLIRGIGCFFDDRSKNCNKLVGLIQEISKLFFRNHFGFN